MKYNAEEYFVNNYVIKEKRGRLLFELNGKKRRDGIGRFCHGADEILIGRKIILSGKKSINSLSLGNNIHPKQNLKHKHFAHSYKCLDFGFLLTSLNTNG